VPRGGLPLILRPRQGGVPLVIAAGLVPRLVVLVMVVVVLAVVVMLRPAAVGVVVAVMLGGGGGSGGERRRGGVEASRRGGTRGGRGLRGLVLRHGGWRGGEGRVTRVSSDLLSQGWLGVEAEED
jgi:hypothetical protein